MVGAPDPIFADRRLAEIYDPLDPHRVDLDAYAAIAAEFGARSVLDVGCGTGTFACLLAAQGFDVVAVDPAVASLNVAKRKPQAERVKWLLGDATMLPTLRVDLATMTGNVAQVFLDDEVWRATLRGVRDALRPGGRVVFEVRDPARKAWQKWNRDQSYERIDIAGVGPVSQWVEVTDVSGQMVTFIWTFQFAQSGEMIRSESTLRFRSRSEIASSLASVGLRLVEVRDAPDRPGLELVFVAERDH